MSHWPKLTSVSFWKRRKNQLPSYFCIVELNTVTKLICLKTGRRNEYCYKQPNMTISVIQWKMSLLFIFTKSPRYILYDHVTCIFVSGQGLIWKHISAKASENQIRSLTFNFIQVRLNWEFLNEWIESTSLWVEFSNPKLHFINFKIILRLPGWSIG